MDEVSQDSSCLEVNLKSNNNNTRLKPKKVMFIRGNNSNLVTTLLMKDFSRLKKPHSVYLKKKYDIKPFEDATSIEDLAREQNCALFIFSSHNKKRPNNLIIGRLSEDDLSIKEMIEFGIENFHSMQEVKGPKLPENSRLCLSFSGSSFQECNDYRLFKELFSEIFQGHSRADEKLSKVDYFVKLISEKGAKCRFESTRVIPRYKSSKLCKIEYNDLGPNFDFFIRRVKLFTSEDLMDIPEETQDEILAKSELEGEQSTLTANSPIDNNQPILTNGDRLAPKPERGTKRHQDDLNERLKRMKFVD